MTANEIIIEAKKSIINAIQTESVPIELKIKIGKEGGIIRAVDILEVCTKEEISLIKNCIIAGMQREIDVLKTKPCDSI